MPKGRATTDQQKMDIVLQIFGYWVRNPNQRLGQLLENAADFVLGQQDIFYVEDDQLVDMLEEYSRVPKAIQEHR